VPTVIGAVGQAEREAVLERQREGITTSKREAGSEGRAPPVRQTDEIIRLRDAGVRPSEIASKLACQKLLSRRGGFLSTKTKRAMSEAPFGSPKKRRRSCRYGTFGEF